LVSERDKLVLLFVIVEAQPILCKDSAKSPQKEMNNLLFYRPPFWLSKKW